MWMITILTEFAPAIYEKSTWYKIEVLVAGAGDRQGDGECGIAGDGTEPGMELCKVSAGAVAGGVLALGGEGHPAAFAVEDIRRGWAIGVVYR